MRLPVSILFVENLSHLPDKSRRNVRWVSPDMAHSAEMETKSARHDWFPNSGIRLFEQFAPGVDELEADLVAEKPDMLDDRVHRAPAPDGIN